MKFYERSLQAILSSAPRDFAARSRVLERLVYFAQIGQLARRLANKEKCEFFRDRVQFCGHEIDRGGLHNTQEKTEAVVSAPRPENVLQLRSFLRIVNYHNRFLPNASTLLHTSHQLSEQDSEWQWTEQCEQVFTEAKRMITSEQVLTHFDPALLVRLACDASPTGFGAVLVLPNR